MQIEVPEMGDKYAEPSETLWIGFPAFLKVDEPNLRKTFSPFGEILKITTFPRRTYAFVQFRDIMSACRAKEALHLKLFGNNVVEIHFAKTETVTSNSRRNSKNAPRSTDFRSYGSLGSSDNVRQEMNIGNSTADPSLRFPHFLSDLDPRTPDIMTFQKFQRKGNLWTCGNSAFEQGSFQDLSSELSQSENISELHSNPSRDRGLHFCDLSPQRLLGHDDGLVLPEEHSLYHGAKKCKITALPPENILPGFHFSTYEPVNHVRPRIPDFPQLYAQPYGERSVTHEVWKWEGTLAKGGTPICRARCFPVRKGVLLFLPKFIDCTARTSLDLFTKRYYEASSAWVVFFIPESDADIGFFNEFMSYLVEKQRVAIAELDGKVTLFFVPPSEFSEKVLMVPGNRSIPGVILRLEHPGFSVGSLHNPREEKDTSFLSFHGDTSYPKPTSLSGPCFSIASSSNFLNPGVLNISFPGKLPTAALPVSYADSAHAIRTMPDPIDDNRHGHMFHQANPSLGPKPSAHQLQNSVFFSPRNIASQAFTSAVNFSTQGYNPAMPMDVQQASSTNYATGNSSITLTGSGNQSLQDTNAAAALSMPAASLNPELLRQLASSLFERQSGVVSVGKDFTQSRNSTQPENSYRPPQILTLPKNHVGSEFSSSQFVQVEQQQQLQPPQQQTPNVLAMHSGEFSTLAQRNQLLPNTGTLEVHTYAAVQLASVLQHVQQ